MLEARCRPVDRTASPLLQRGHRPLRLVGPEATALTGPPHRADAETHRRGDLLVILRTAVEAIEPGGLVRAALSRGAVAVLPSQSVFLVSAGKAAWAMARAFADV